MNGLPENTCEAYGEHRGERIIHEDDEVVHWECTVCGAEGWMDQ